MNETTKKDALIIVSITAIAFVIRVAGVSKIGMYPDEADYRTWSNMILINNWVPVAEVFDYVNPFLSHLGALVTTFFGGDLNTLRMISVFFGTLAVPFLYLFGKTIYDRKTGVLAALLLCFSAYHCLFSRIFMLEALTFFFITAFLYFFWVSQSSEEPKSTKYAIVAGAMLGLAVDAKYISLFLGPAIIAYVLWTNRFDFRALLDKRIVLTVIFAFLFFLPLLICLFYTGVGLHPLYYQSVERFSGASGPSSTRVSELPINVLLEKTVVKIPEVLAWGTHVLTPYWGWIFAFAVLILFILTAFYYIRSFMRRDKADSFLTISAYGFFMFVFVGCAGTKYYLIYSFPFLLVMFSHLGVKSFEALKSENNYKNIGRIFTIFLVAIMLFSSFATAVTSPHWDTGEYSWSTSGVEFIKNDVAKSGYDGRILIGRLSLSAIVGYSIYTSDLNATTFLIVTPTGKYSTELVEVDLEMINSRKPHYLIVEELYSYCLKGEVARAIYEDYSTVFYSKTFPYQCSVLKRKDMQPSEPVSRIADKDGKISEEVFRKSVPDVLEMGEVYTALVQVTNTGDSRTNFSVRVFFDWFNLYVKAEQSNEVTLNKDATQILKFKIVPLTEYAGEIPISASLYVKSEENEEIEVDSVSDYIYLIER